MMDTEKLKAAIDGAEILLDAARLVYAARSAPGEVTAACEAYQRIFVVKLKPERAAVALAAAALWREVNAS
jgi:hypothetical protein